MSEKIKRLLLNIWDLILFVKFIPSQMKTYKGQTDKVKKVELDSSIEQICWSTMTPYEGTVDIEKTFEDYLKQNETMIVYDK